MKKILALLSIIISSISASPVIAAPEQPVNTKSFAAWCQNKLSMPIEAKRTINLLLEEAGTNNCQMANSKLKRLTYLILIGKQISDLRPLASLTNLKTLYLGDNKISNVRPLASLTNLKGLILEHNQISDVKSLANLTSLTSLIISNNQINDIKSLDNLTKLNYIDIRSNQITKKICPVKPELICQF
jgi:internalin A